MSILGVNRIGAVASSVTGRVARALPNFTVRGDKANKVISWIGKNVSSPENRLILGVSALLSQPFIDLRNKKVEEETRKVSACRTVAKIIAGTLTGVLVRAGCIKAIDAFTMLPNAITSTTRFKPLRSLFTPDAFITGVLKDLSQYKKSLGTLISLAVMTVTNFAVDAPLTKYLTNKFVARVQNNDKSKHNLYNQYDDIRSQVEKHKEVIIG